jgi:predicted 2-oxoglutarate/Fe(II)-dependent dioxygenase YbiX
MLYNKERIMSNTVEDFANKKYAYLPEFLDKDNCQQLTTELKNLINQGFTVKDNQCPISEAIHGSVVFDSLLEQLLPYFEQACGKQLLPTYSYARLYEPGDELKLHLDRPACEISVTLTLGFEGNPWPILVANQSSEVTGTPMLDDKGQTQYVGEINEYKMNVGDAIIYRGQEVFHWRIPYKEGKWQAQVFLHYVDANGPHATEKYDGRQGLSHHNTNVAPKAEETIFWYYSDALSPDACKKLIESYEQLSIEKAKIGLGATGVIDKKIRDVGRITLPTYRGIGATMAGIGLDANMKAWNFNVTHADQTDYLKYDVDGHYKQHLDTFLVPNTNPTRKLTILLFLNDDFEGGKLFLQTGHEKVYPPQTPGTVIVFPSFLVHGVEPVTNGIRRSVVTWLVGPWFR